MTTYNEILEIIKENILDFQEVSVESGIRRDLESENINKKASIFIGVRRSGKSTYLFQIINKLLKNGVSKQNILYLNFFDDRLHHLQKIEAKVILDAYFSLYPEKKNSETIYCFFDEIQILPKWEPFAERVLRTEKSEVYITGSSAQMLSKEIATQMRGRSLTWEIFPFSFTEFLRYKKLDIKTDSKNLSSKNILLLNKAFDEYWETGGFPEVINLKENLRVKVHQEYFQSILFKDLIERHNISEPKTLIDLAYFLIHNIASLYSINSLTNYLKSLGHKTSKTTVSNFLFWIEDCYFLFTVKLFDASLRRSNLNQKKIYCIDHAIVNSISSKILVNSGHLLENFIFITLRRKYQEIYYYRTKNNKEVDFIVITDKREKILIQVCQSLDTSKKTRDREITALVEAIHELNLNTGFIITQNESQTIKEEHKTIEVIPAWKFALFNY